MLRKPEHICSCFLDWCYQAGGREFQARLQIFQKGRAGLLGALQLLNWSHVATAVDHKMQMPASPFQLLCEPGHLLDVCEPSKGSGLTWSAAAG